MSAMAGQEAVLPKTPPRGPAQDMQLLEHATLVTAPLAPSRLWSGARRLRRYEFAAYEGWENTGKGGRGRTLDGRWAG
ncbi:hypothetical protein GCM10023317_72170 [Actinopolymorpha pittospori]